MLEKMKNENILKDSKLCRFVSKDPLLLFFNDADFKTLFQIYEMLAGTQRSDFIF